MISTPLNLLDIVAFADPAGSKTEVKRVQARSAIAVLGGDAHDHIFVLEVWAARCSTDQFVARIFDTFERWRPRLFGIEANAMQSLFADMLRREARMRVARVPFIDVRQPTRIEKPFRNRSALQTPINTGQLLMMKDQVEAYNELATHPMCSQFDRVDCIATASGLLRRRSKVEVADEDARAFAAYLRKSGRSPREIEAALAKRHMELDVPPRPGIS